jgi:hypothetical protein
MHMTGNWAISIKHFIGVFTQIIAEKTFCLDQWHTASNITNSCLRKTNLHVLSQIMIDQQITKYQRLFQ